MADQAPWEKYAADGPWAKYQKYGMGQPKVDSDPHRFVHAIAPTALSTGVALLGPETMGASMALRGGASAAGQAINEVIDRKMGWNPGDGVGPTAKRIGIHGAVGALMAPADKYVINPLLKNLGTKIYGAGIPAVVHEGEKYGKDGVSDELIKAGAWNPFSMPDKAQEAASTLTDERNAIFGDAASKGARASVQAAMDPTIASIAKMGDDPAKDAAVKKGEDWVEKYLGMQNQAPTPQEASDLATSFDKNVASQGLFGIPKPGAQEEVEKSIMRGLKDESIRSTEEALPGKGQAVKELNQRIGRLLSTLQTQTAASQGADRAAAGGAVNAIGHLAVGNPTSAILSAAKTAAQALTMPAGYAMVKSSAYPSLLSNYAAQLGAGKLAEQENPWSLFKRKDDSK